MYVCHSSKHDSSLCLRGIFPLLSKATGEHGPSSLTASKHSSFQHLRLLANQNLNTYTMRQPLVERCMPRMPFLANLRCERASINRTCRFRWNPLLSGTGTIAATWHVVGRLLLLSEQTYP